MIHTSDQGRMPGEHDYIDKRWMYQESKRTPFIIKHVKSTQANTRTKALINNVDYAPTLLSLAGSNTPIYLKGKSFANALLPPESFQKTI